MLVSGQQGSGWVGGWAVSYSFDGQHVILILLQIALFFLFFMIYLCSFIFNDLNLYNPVIELIILQFNESVQTEVTIVVRKNFVSL